MIVASDTPESHPRITEIEKNYIQSSIGTTTKTNKRRVGTNSDGNYHQD